MEPERRVPGILSDEILVELRLQGLRELVPATFLSAHREEDLLRLDAAPRVIIRIEHPHRDIAIRAGRHLARLDIVVVKAVDLNLEIERHEKLKENNAEKNLKAKSELRKYKAIDENLEIILADKNIIKTTEEKLHTKKESCL